jgi:hypothetical protein
MMCLAGAGEISLGVGLEFLGATLAAKVIESPLVIDRAGGARRLDGHAADRIERHVS